MDIAHSFSRRDVIKIGAGFAAAGLLARYGFAQVPSNVAVFVTDASSRRHARFDDGLRTNGDTAVVFKLDATQPLQPILGFGAAFTEATCTVLSRLKADDRAALFDDLFNPAKTGLGTGRLCIGASDYSTELYSYDEGEADPSLSRFSIDHDRKAVLPILKQAREVRPDLFLFGSPWSPPGWMKYGGSMLGGSINPRNLRVYANYIAEYLKAYADAGVSVDAITMQNELDADQYGNMPACTWSEEIERTYITQNLAPVLAENHLATQVWMLDHNYDLSGRVLDQLTKPQMRKHVNAVAWHGYEGSPERMMAVQKQYPEMPMHWTEGGDNVGSKTLETAWSDWGRTFAGILNNGCRSITCWNLALDEAGKPNIGPFHCAGVLTVDSHTQAVKRNGIFWALSHYSKAMPRGSRILKCEALTRTEVTAVAASRPDGSIAVVLSNPGKAVAVQLHLGNDQSALNLTADSVTTIIIG